MKSPGKTTLFRMQAAAHNEAQRIEISQDGNVKLGWLKEPLPDQVRLRDDFVGIVKLIDLIESDQTILKRLQELMSPQAVYATSEISAPAEEETTQ